MTVVLTPYIEALGVACSPTAMAQAQQGQAFPYAFKVRNDGNETARNLQLQVSYGGANIRYQVVGDLPAGWETFLYQDSYAPQADGMLWLTAWENAASAGCGIGVQAVGGPGGDTTLSVCLEAGGVVACDGGSNSLMVEPGTVVPFNATMTNVGGAEAIAARLVDNTGATLWQGNLAPGQQVTASFNRQVNVSGWYFAGASAQNAPEISASLYVQVVSTQVPDLVPNLMALATSCGGNGQAQQGQPFDYWVSATNQGSGRATNVRLRVFYGKTPIDDIYHGTLEAGQSTPQWPGSVTAQTNALLTLSVTSTEDNAQCSIGVQVVAPGTTLQVCVGINVDGGPEICSPEPPGAVTVAPGSYNTVAILANIGESTAHNAELRLQGAVVWSGDLQPNENVLKGAEIMTQSDFSLIAEGSADDAPTVTARIDVVVETAPVLVPRLEALAVVCSPTAMAQAQQGQAFQCFFSVRNDGAGDAHNVGLWLYWGEDQIAMEGVGLLPAGGSSGTFQAAVTPDIDKLLYLAVGSAEGPADCGIGVEVVAPVGARLEMCLSGQGTVACAGEILQISLLEGGSVEIGVEITARDADVHNLHLEVRRDDTGQILTQEDWPLVLQDQVAQHSFTLTAEGASPLGGPGGPVPLSMVATGSRNGHSSQG